jgi:hypothetical protein
MNWPMTSLPGANVMLRSAPKGIAAIAFLCLCTLNGAGAPAPQGEIAGTAGSVANTFITFVAPGAGTGMLQGTVSIAINAEGVVTGFYYDANRAGHGFVRAANGTITDFEAPAAGTSKNQGTFPIGINAAGEIAGLYLDASNVYHGFVRASGGTLTSFDISGASKTRHRGTIPFGIDPAGDVTGTYVDASSVYHGFVRLANGKVTTFNVSGAGTGNDLGTTPIGINGAGEITGFYAGSNGTYQGFVRAANGAITTFEAPSAGTGFYSGTFPLAINAGGEVAGMYLDASSVAHGFARASNGTITPFDISGAGTAGFGLPGTGGFSINTAGSVAGSYSDAKSVYHGFVRSAGGTFTSFEVPGASTGVGTYEGTGAFGINTAGAVAGTYIDSKFVFHGFVRSAEIPTTTTLKSSLNPSVFGRPVTLTAEVASSDAAIPDGEVVTFMNGGAVLGTGVLSDGKASLKTLALPVGSDSISAVYRGDPNFAASKSKPLIEVVGKSPSTVVLISSPNPSKVGQEVKFTATVTSAAAQIHTGTVTFKNGTVTLATVALNAGKAAFSTSALTQGTHSITAEFNGKVNYLPKTSAVLTQVVDKAAATTPRRRP